MEWSVIAENGSVRDGIDSKGKLMSRNMRGRFAPSPSGRMHLGNAWAALLAWLDLRKLNGTMVLRMEDLDPDRCRPEYAEGLLEDLRWLGLDWDEGPDRGGPHQPYSQSERPHLYQAAFDLFDKQGLIYPCFCSRAELRSIASAPHAGESGLVYKGCCAELSPHAQQLKRFSGKQSAYRLRVGDTNIKFCDQVLGSQEQLLKESCGDFVIRRTDGVYAYQLAVVVDDAAMGINRVLRGADLLASTPRQIYLWQLLGSVPPTFIHVPLLMGSDGARLSKRHGSLSIAELRRLGVKAEVIVGYLAFLAGLTNQPEPVRASELIASFSLGKLPVDPVIVENEFSQELLALS
jgi:glutamyl-tRNA synthetase